MKSLPTHVRVSKTIAELEKLGAEIELDPQGEDIDPADQIEDKKTVDRIRERYNAGNIWAWFCAKVTVKYKGIEATDYLGACSYKDRKDFEKDGYYHDMITNCIDDINKEVEERNAEIFKNFEIRKAKNILSKYGLLVAKSL